MHLLPKKYVIEFSIGKILLIQATRNLPRGHVIQMGSAVLTLIGYKQTIRQDNKYTCELFVLFVLF